MTNKERIKADAERFTKDEGYQKIYITGATAEHDRAQEIVDALEELIQLKKIKDELGKTTNYLARQPEVWQRAITALEQWKSGKPDRPCPHCNKELSRDRNLCCRECGKEVGDDA